ncbi:MAG: M56 family metallopeptidase, partial [Verrucomicrobiae bacterium]|nr:M56 family metallopeptidase [Verrucomicrobiae bacterium]
MTATLELLHSPDTTRLGWTLVHFLWQGAVLAAAFAAVRSTLRRTSANARYLAGCLTLLLMGTCVVGTFVTLGPAERFHSSTAPAVTPPPATLEIQSTAQVAPVIPRSPMISDRANGAWQAVESGLPWVVGLWALGVALFSLRLAGGWLKVRQSRRGSCLSPDDPLCERFRELRHRLRVSRHVQLMKSTLVRVPTVVGWFRPLILLPASTLSGLSPVQLDLILAHELAHLRRWDHWVNLVQLLLETVLFYHPAVWWVWRCVREDREHCCDEMAVAACGNRLAFAKALTALEELRQTHPAFALAATDGSLLARVRRILALPDDERGGVDRRAAGSALLALGVLTFATGVLLVVTSPARYTAVARLQNSANFLGLVTADAVEEGSSSGSFLFKSPLAGAEGQVIRPSDGILERILKKRWQSDLNRTNAPSPLADLEELRRRVRLRRTSFPVAVEIEVESRPPEEAHDVVELANR